VMAFLNVVAEGPDPAAAVAGRAGDGALLPGFARFSVLESAN
jgi:hypothetical protein